MGKKKGSRSSKRKVYRFNESIPAIAAEPIRPFGDQYIKSPYGIPTIRKPQHDGITFPDSGVLVDFIKNKVMKFVKKYTRKEGKRLEKEIINEVETILNEHHTAVEKNLRDSFQTMANEHSKQITQMILSNKFRMNTHAPDKDEDTEYESDEPSNNSTESANHFIDKNLSF